MLFSSSSAHPIPVVKMTSCPLSKWPKVSISTMCAHFIGRCNPSFPANNSIPSKCGRCKRSFTRNPTCIPLFRFFYFLYFPYLLCLCYHFFTILFVRYYIIYYFIFL